MRRGVILLLSCNANRGRWPRIREEWLDATGIPYVFVVGDPNDDNDECVLHVPCDDGYDALPQKVALAMCAIHTRYRPDYVLKIDDDVVASPAILKSASSGIPPHVRYGGKVIRCNGITVHGADKFSNPANCTPMHMKATYCGGPAYFVDAHALSVLAVHMQKEALGARYEDVLVGTVLQKHGIFPEPLPIYTDREAEFRVGKFAAWHNSRGIVV